jgi:PilZ domain
MFPRPVLERRSAKRYKLRLPVIFDWNDGVVEHTEGGFTRDVALNGAMILSSRCPPVGADIRIEVLIPSPGHIAEEIRIECVGKVTRVEEHTGFGVRGFFNDDHLTRYVLR